LELKKALQSGNPEAAIQGFEDMIRFIYTLADERDDTTGKKLCPEITADKSKLKEGLAII